MNDDPIPLSRRGLVIPVPEEGVTVRRDLPFPGASGRALAMDVYLPEGAAGPRPAVWIASGYRDEGFAAAVGCRFKEMQWTKDWARLLAASGVAAIAATNEDPGADLRAGFEALSRMGDQVGVDPQGIGLFATSGHVPVALSALMKDFPFEIRRAAFAYGYTLDLGGKDAVARAAATFRFANPCAGRTVEDLRDDVPLLLVRAGRDEMPGLNDALDAFVLDALRLGLPLMVENLPRPMRSTYQMAAMGVVRPSWESSDSCPGPDPSFSLSPAFSASPSAGGSPKTPRTR